MAIIGVQVEQALNEPLKAGAGGKLGVGTERRVCSARVCVQQGARAASASSPRPEPRRWAVGPSAARPGRPWRHKEGQQKVTLLACAKPGARQEGFISLWFSNRAAERHYSELPKYANTWASSAARRPRPIGIFWVRRKRAETLKTSEDAVWECKSLTGAIDINIFTDNTQKCNVEKRKRWKKSEKMFRLL